MQTGVEILVPSNISSSQEDVQVADCVDGPTRSLVNTMFVGPKKVNLSSFMTVNSMYMKGPMTGMLTLPYPSILLVQ